MEWIMTAGKLSFLSLMLEVQETNEQICLPAYLCPFGSSHNVEILRDSHTYTYIYVLLCYPVRRLGPGWRLNSSIGFINLARLSESSFGYLKVLGLSRGCPSKRAAFMEVFELEPF